MIYSITNTVFPKGFGNKAIRDRFAKIIKNSKKANKQACYENYLQFDIKKFRTQMHIQAWGYALCLDDIKRNKIEL